MVAEILIPGVARVYRCFGGASTYHIQTLLMEELQNRLLYDIHQDGYDLALLPEVNYTSLILPYA